MARFWRHNERLSPYDDNAFTEEELESIADTVRESSFIDDHSGRSIDERMTEFFGGFEPNWICFQAPDAVCYVNCYGVLRRGRQAIKVELQFELSDDLEDFALTGLSINNRPQPEMAVAEFEESFAAPAPGQELPASAEYDDAEETEPEDDGWYDDEYDDYADEYGRDIAEYDLYEEDGEYDDHAAHDHRKDEAQGGIGNAVCKYGCCNCAGECADAHETGMAEAQFTGDTNSEVEGNSHDHGDADFHHGALIAAGNHLGVDQQSDHHKKDDNR